jgi:TIR domain
MDVIDSIRIDSLSGVRTIDLCKGDLTRLGPDEAIDILVVSAFPNDYLPTSGSLIGALGSRGVWVVDLATRKAVDLRTTCSCWLSEPILPKLPGIEFKRILCFEPGFRGDPPQVVGDIFRSLVPFIGSNLMGTTVAMPLVACGDQGVPVAKMIRPLLEAAINWMKLGLPLERLKVVVYSSHDAAQAAAEFARMKSQHGAPPVAPVANPEPKFDVFLSYATKDWETVSVIAEELKAKDDRVKVFLDRVSIDVGSAWQQKLYEALDDCRKVIAVLSPAYLESKWCLEEFNIALCRQRDTGESIIHPFLLYKCKTPYYIKMIQHEDCTEGDVTRLKSCSQVFLANMLR